MCQLLCAIQLQDKKIDGSGMLHVSGRKFCIGTVSPKKIGPAGSPDGTAGILVEDKPFKRFPCLDSSFPVHNRSGCFNIDNGGRWKDATIQGKGSFGGQRDLQVSDRPFLFQLEKHIAWIMV